LLPFPHADEEDTISLKNDGKPYICFLVNEKPTLLYFSYGN
jgi:hypothetical protein